MGYVKKQCCWGLKLFIKLEGFMLRMIRPTLSAFFGQIFVDTYLLSYWLLVPRLSGKTRLAGRV